MKLSGISQLLLLTLLLLASYIVNANNFEFKRDSLKNEFMRNFNRSEGADKIQSSLDLAQFYFQQNHDSAFKYIKVAEKLSIEFNDTESKMEVWLQLGNLYNFKGEPAKAIDYYDNVLKFSIKTHNDLLTAKTYLAFSTYYQSKFSYSNVLNVLDSARIYIEKNDIKELKPELFYRIGYLFFALGDYYYADYYVSEIEEALSRYPTIEYSVKKTLLQAKLAAVNSNTELMQNLFSEALKLSKESASPDSYLLTYRRIASFYMNSGEFEEANKYIDKAIKVCLDFGREIDYSTLLTYRSHIEYLKENYKGSLKYNLQALEIRKKIGHAITIASSYINVGGDYVKLKQLDSAYIFLSKGIDMSDKQGLYKYVALGYGKLSEMYENQGDYKSALYFNKLENDFFDTFNSKVEQEKVHFFRGLYGIEKNKRIKDEIDLQRKKQNNQFLLFLSVLLSLFILLLGWIIRVRSKSSREIRKLSKIIETTNQGVIIVDHTFNINYVNKGGLDIGGWDDTDELIGKNVLDFIVSDRIDTLKIEVLSKLRKDNYWSGEISFYTKTEKLRTAYLTLSMIDQGRSPNDLMVGIYTDITDLKKKEMELKESRTQLQKTVETQETMFSILAHDLVNPFNTILGFTSELANNFSNYDIEQQKTFSRLIYESSKQTYNLLNNLLHWSRSQFGKIKIEKTTFSLFEVVNENLNLLSYNTSTKNLDMQNNVLHDFQILADKPTIDIVIRNLLSNAVKFTPKKGKITISAEELRSEVRIIISDTGVGISAKELPLLFSSNLGRSTPGTDDEAGTGLGLVLCKDLVKLNNGKISVESTLGEGSTFTISLPKF